MGNSCNAKESNREDFMIVILFHPLLKDATRYIREAGRRIPPKNLLKVSSIREKITVSDLVSTDQPKTCMIAVFNR